MTTTLRAEFEQLLISPYGLHLDAERAARGWEKYSDCDDRLREEIARADEWLRLRPRTKAINRRVGTSYGLKHQVESWHRQRNPAGNCYVANGCFLMAAQRLGFKMEGVQGSYWGERGRTSWDCFNAYINLSSSCDRPIGRGGTTPRAAPAAGEVGMVGRLGTVS
jgi:hypothetical protein